jgi:hypothetical protein
MPSCVNRRSAVGKEPSPLKILSFESVFIDLCSSGFGLIVRILIFYRVPLEAAPL